MNDEELPINDELASAYLDGHLKPQILITIGRMISSKVRIDP